MRSMKEFIKDDIVHAAKSLFYNEGYQKTTIRRIANVLGIYHSNVLYYFKNKESILKVILEEFYEKFLELIYEIQEEMTVFELILCTIYIGDGFISFNKKFQHLYFESTEIVIEILYQYALEYYPKIKNEELNPLLESKYLIDVAVIVHAQKEIHKIYQKNESKLPYSYLSSYITNLFANIQEVDKKTLEKAQLTAKKIARVVDYSRLNIFDEQYRIKLV